MKFALLISKYRRNAALSLGTKYEIISRLQYGETADKLPDEYRIGVLTNRWASGEEKEGFWIFFDERFAVNFRSRSLEVSVIR